MKTFKALILNSFLMTLLVISTCGVALAVDAEVAAVDQALEETQAAVVETTTEAVVEEVAVEEEAAPSTSEHAPTVYIVPLGKEMNLKVIYDHPMDHEGGNSIEQVLMEAPNGDFLGLKTFNTRHKKAIAEFLVNPALANFESVVLIGKSSTLGEIRSTVDLEFTPEDQLPDEYNPRKMRERLAKMRADAIAKANKGKEKAAKKAAPKPKKVVEKQVEEVTEVAEESAQKETKKKKFGLF